MKAHQAILDTLQQHGHVMLRRVLRGEIRRTGDIYLNAQVVDFTPRHLAGKRWYPKSGEQLMRIPLNR